MSLIKDEENDIDEKNLKIISMIKIIENIFNNYIFRHKYYFFDNLLNYWYNINQNIINDKINEYDNTSSVFIYNCYKNFLYSIIIIFNKYKISYDFHFISNLKDISLKKKYLISILENEQNKSIIKKQVINILKIKIDNNMFNNDIIEEIYLIFGNEMNKYEIYCKNIFIYKLININFQNIKNLEIINKFYFRRMQNNEEIYKKNYIFIYFSKWIKYYFIDLKNLFYFYLNKIKFFQCNNIIYIYKRRLKNIYNIFINNYKDFFSINLNNREKNKKDKIKALLTIIPLKKFIVRKKAYVYRNFISFYYSITREIIFFNCIKNIINIYLIKYKNNFITNLRIYSNIKKRNILIYSNNMRNMFSLLFNIIFFYKYNIFFYFIN